MKEIFHILMPYLDTNYYAGRLVRWMIANKRGRSVYCTFCGNIANGIGHVHFMKNDFYLPICKKHAIDYLRLHRNTQKVSFPDTIIEMNIKSITANHSKEVVYA